MIASTRVLVLNKSWAPVAVTGVERAFGLLCAGAARALDKELRAFDFESWSALSAEAGDDVVRTVKSALKVPRIVVLQTYDRMPKKVVRFSRHNVYVRDGFTCQYCGAKLPRSKLNLDHVVPRSQGGATSWENVVCSCVPCNTKKGARTPKQAGLRLAKAPARPSWRGLSASGVPYDEWLPFVDWIDASYWNSELT